MDQRTPVKLCGAKTRSDTKCKRPAGTGTDHLGSGRCKLHGGATTSGKQAAAKGRAMDLAVASMASMERLDPTEALLIAVWRSASIARGYHEAVQSLPDGDVRDLLVRELRGANKEQATIAHLAVSSRVAERSVEAMNRLAVAFAMAAQAAFQAGMAAAGVEDVFGAQETFAAALEENLGRLEDHLPDVAGVAVER